MKKSEHVGITQDDFSDLLGVYRKYVADAVDGAGKVRQVTLVPTHVAIKVARVMSNSSARYLLACLGEEVAPEAPAEVIAMSIDDRLEARATRTLTAELAAPPGADSDSSGDDDDDDTPAGRRVLAIVPSKKLRKQTADYTAWRTVQLNGERDGEAVADSSVNTEVNFLLRFLGWLQQHEEDRPRDRYDMRCLEDPEIADDFETYAKELIGMGRKQSTIGGYAHCLYQLVAYTLRKEEVTQPAQMKLYKLRAQALKGAKKDKKWEKRSVNWISWGEAQVARLRAVDAYKQYRAYDDQSAKVKAKLLRRAVLVGLMTVLPPDRVGVIRQLKYDSTLVEDDMQYMIDLRDSRNHHKTSKFFGPTVTKLPMGVSLLIVEYRKQRESLRKTPGTEPMTDFLFFCGNTDKLMSASQFSQLTGKSFEGLTGKKTTMKLLRASFVTWLRSRRDVPKEVLEATAHAMKHRLETDESSVYDLGLHEKVSSAAFDFCTRFSDTFDERWADKRLGSNGTWNDPPPGTPKWTGDHGDECLHCQGDDPGQTVVCCEYCARVCHTAKVCISRQPVPLDQEDWWCNVCSRRFEHADGAVASASADARAAAVAHVGGSSDGGSRGGRSGSSRDGSSSSGSRGSSSSRSSSSSSSSGSSSSSSRDGSSSSGSSGSSSGSSSSSRSSSSSSRDDGGSTPPASPPTAPQVTRRSRSPVHISGALPTAAMSISGDQMSLPLRGDICIIKRQGDQPFRLATIVTDATGDDLTCDVWWHMPTSTPAMKLNLQGRWAPCYLVKNTMKRTMGNARHFDSRGQRLIETISLGWYSVLWGPREDVVDSTKKAKTVAPLSLAALKSLEANDSLDWDINWSLRSDGKRKVSAAGTASKKPRV